MAFGCWRSWLQVCLIDGKQAEGGTNKYAHTSTMLERMRHVDFYGHFATGMVSPSATKEQLALTPSSSMVRNATRPKAAISFTGQGMGQRFQTLLCMRP